MAIDVVTEATPAAETPTIELGPDLSIYVDRVPTAPDPSQEPLENAVSDTPVTDQPEADTSASLQAGDETPDAESTTAETPRRERTRLLKDEEIEQIRADERSKMAADLERTQTLEAQQAESQQRWQTLQEQAKDFNPPEGLEEQIVDAARRSDWDFLAQHGVYSERDALDKSQEIKDKRAVNAMMLGYWQQVFMGSTGEAWKSATERTGAKWETIQQEQDVGKSLTMLLDAERASVESEYKGRIEELETALANSKARNGAGVSSPETGGSASASSSWTWDRYNAAVVSGEMDKKSPEERDRITQMLWERDPRGRS